MHPSFGQRAFFILTFGYRGCRISMWFAGLPTAFCGWKLEAVKQAGDNPPAKTVQVITGPFALPAALLERRAFSMPYMQLYHLK